MATTGIVDDRSVSTSQSVKRRAACDECRTKKLKCSGEHPACRRCEREGIPCNYSPQKTMGRPKKRLRDEVEHALIPRRRPKPNNMLGNPHAANSSGFADLNMSTIQHKSAHLPGNNVSSSLQTDYQWTSHGDHEINVPSLTPDNSASYSPSLLNLPLELQADHSDPELLSHSQTVQYQIDHADASMAAVLDSSLVSDIDLGCPPSSIADCACLSSMYLTLGTLSGMSSEDTLAFPYALHPLREAMQTASSVLACTECPRRFITAIQNTQLVGTLLLSIAERYSKVLQHITSESMRAAGENETKQFRLADLSTSTSHLHTGGIGCVAAFSLDLTPEEWRKLCKKVVKAEVMGPSSGNECCCYLEGVLKQMEDRQAKWHTMKPVEDFPRDDQGKLVGGPRAMIDLGDIIHVEGDKGTILESVAAAGAKKKEDHLCLKLVVYARKIVDGYDWT